MSASFSGSLVAWGRINDAELVDYSRFQEILRVLRDEDAVCEQIHLLPPASAEIMKTLKFLDLRGA